MNSEKNVGVKRKMSREKEHKKIGNQSVRFSHRPYFIGRGNIVGQKEG